MGEPDGSIPSYSSTKYREMIKQKEVEMQELNERQMVELEQALASKDDELLKARQEFHRLQYDFKYNLQLLEDRDEELRHYEVKIGSHKTVVLEKEAMISKLREELARSEETSHELRIHNEGAAKQNQFRIDDLTAVAEAKQAEFSRALTHVQQDLRDVKDDLTRRLAEKDAALSDQHRTLTTKLGDQVCQFDYDRLKYEEQLHAMEQKLEAQEKSLESELRLVEDAKTTAEEELQRFRESLQESDQKISMLTVDLSALQKEKDKESMRHHEILRDKDRRIEDMARQVRAAHKEAEKRIQLMDAQMEKKASESLVCLRKIAEETQEKHKKTYDDLSRELAKSKALYEKDINRLQEQLARESEVAATKNASALEEEQKKRAGIDEKLEILSEEKKKLEQTLHAERSQWVAERDQQAAVYGMKSEDEKRRILDEAKSVSEEQERMNGRAIKAFEKEVQELNAEVEDLKKSLKEENIGKEEAVAEVICLRKHLDAVGKQALKGDTDDRGEKGKSEVKFEPLWPGDLGPPSPVKGDFVFSPAASAQFYDEPGEMERLRKQVDDYREVISKMKADAQHLRLADDVHQAKSKLEVKLKEKDNECDVLRQRNWNLKQENDRLVEERKQLMDLSNTLRADILRRQSLALEREGETTQNKGKLEEIEASLKDLTAHNLSFARVTSQGHHESPYRQERPITYAWDAPFPHSSHASSSRPQSLPVAAGYGRGHVSRGERYHDQYEQDLRSGFYQEDRWGNGQSEDCRPQYGDRYGRGPVYDDRNSGACSHHGFSDKERRTSRSPEGTSRDRRDGHRIEGNNASQVLPHAPAIPQALTRRE